jgi:hypothetical protein
MALGSHENFYRDLKNIFWAGMNHNEAVEFLHNKF